MNSYSILSFDPGLTTLGYAYCVFDLDTNKLIVQRFGTFKSTKLANKEKCQSALFGTRLIALNLLEEEVKRLIDLFKPTYIASEDVFLHIRHINAFAALTLCLHTIKRSSYARNKTVYTLAPCDIKKETSGVGHADKNAIQKSILSNANIEIVENKLWPIDKMCEHEADAIAVAYSFCKSILPNLILANNINTNNDDTLDISILHKRKKRLTKSEKEELEKEEVGIKQETAEPVDVFKEYAKKHKVIVKKTSTTPINTQSNTDIQNVDDTDTTKVSTKKKHIVKKTKK